MQVQPRVKRIEAHESIAYAIATSADEEFMASCSQDGSIAIYDRDCKILETLTHPQAVRNIAFAEDPIRLFAPCYDHNVYIYVYDEETGLFRGLTVLENVHSKEIKDITTHKRLFASCGRDRCVNVYQQNELDEFDYDCLSVLQLHMQDIKCVRFDRKTGRLLSTSYDNTIKLYRPSYDGDELDYKLDAEYVSETGADESSFVSGRIDSTVWCAEFYRQNQLVACDANGAVSILGTAEPGKLAVTAEKRVHRNDCYRVHVCGQHILTCGSDGNVNVLDGDLRVVKQFQNLHVGEVNCVAVYNGAIVSCGDDGYVASVAEWM